MSALPTMLQRQAVNIYFVFVFMKIKVTPNHRFAIIIIIIIIISKYTKEKKELSRKKKGQYVNMFITDFKLIRLCFVLKKNKKKKIFHQNQLLQLCTAQTVWSYAVIRHVLARSSKCTSQIRPNRRTSSDFVVLTKNIGVTRGLVIGGNKTVVMTKDTGVIRS